MVRLWREGLVKKWVDCQINFNVVYLYSPCPAIAGGGVMYKNEGCLAYPILFIGYQL